MRRERLCIICGQEFVPLTNAITCSPPCRHANKLRLDRESNARMRSDPAWRDRRNAAHRAAYWKDSDLRERRREEARLRSARLRENPEYLASKRERQREYVASNREHVNRLARDWYQRNKEKVCQWQREYREANRAALLERERDLRAAKGRTDAMRAAERAAYLRNKTRRRSTMDAWKAAHPIVTLAGERVAIHKLPEDIQPIARLIRETRVELKKGGHKNG